MNVASASHEAQISPQPPRSPTPPPDGAELPEPHPYWIPAGVEIDDWPADVRAEAISLINQAYHELVLSATPGLARSTGLTIVHLMWLEIIDHIQLARAKSPGDSSSDPFDIVALASGRESRPHLIERHLRLVGAKLKASEFFLRLQKFSASQSNVQSPLDHHYPNLAATPRRPRKHGKNDFC